MNLARRWLVFVVVSNLVVGALPSRAAADDCEDECHVDHTGGGGSCTPVTDEQKQQEEECIQACEDSRSGSRPADVAPPVSASDSGEAKAE